MIPLDNKIMFVIFIIFCFAAAVQLFYWLWFYLAPSLYKPVAGDDGNVPVSIIICARNEADNLRNFLPSILEQDYPSYEVIVVNDCSEDSSDDVLGKLLMHYPHLRISSINKDPKFTHNKKFAQFIGIKAAANEILLFTDADCHPESDQWLSGMVSNFDEKTDFVLGYGGYLNGKGLLNKYIRYDTMFIALQYLGMALKGITYMGVGRNLAYRRSVFFRNKGFGAHNHTMSGDDDLFVNSNASETNTKVEFRQGTHTRSVPPSTSTALVKQKLRHFTTAKYYKPLHKVLLFLEPFSRMLFYTSFLVLIFALYLWPYTIAIFVIRLVIFLVVVFLTQKRLNEKGLLTISLFFDILSPIINGVLYSGSIRNRTGRNTWKQ
jgi:biofilm PGA synthesis N-glycosyltransferase PgaC